MNILLLDDEIIFYHILKLKFKNFNVFYERNPIEWLDNVSEKKIDLNKFDLIICDYYFDFLLMNCFELKLSKYIREEGFKNKLILFTNLFFTDEELINIKKNEFFDYIFSKSDAKNLTYEKLEEIISKTK